VLFFGLVFSVAPPLEIFLPTPLHIPVKYAKRMVLGHPISSNIYLFLVFFSKSERRKTVVLIFTHNVTKSCNFEAYCVIMTYSTNFPTITFYEFLQLKIILRTSLKANTIMSGNNDTAAAGVEELTVKKEVKFDQEKASIPHVTTNVYDTERYYVPGAVEFAHKVKLDGIKVTSENALSMLSKSPESEANKFESMEISITTAIFMVILVAISAILLLCCCKAYLLCCKQRQAAFRRRDEEVR